MFYNYLIFSMVALSLCILKKHFVSSRKIQHSFRMVRDGREKKKEPANPYMDMFLAVDISSYSEVLYSKGLG